MKQFLIIIAVFCASLNANAQSSITWGEETKLSKSRALKKSLGIYDNILYMSVLYGSNRYLCMADPNNIKLSEPLPIELEDKNQRLLDYVFNKNGKWAVFRTTDKEKKDYVKVLPLGKQGEMMTNKITTIPVTHNIKDAEYTNFSNYLKTSSDSSKNVLIAKVKRYGYSDNLTFSVIVWDDKMNLLWKQLIELPYEQDSFGEADITVTNKGQVVFGGKLYPSKKEKKTEKNYKYIVRIYEADDKDGQEVVMAVDNKFIINAQFSVRPDNDNIVLVGTYSDRWATKFSESNDGLYSTYFNLQTDGVINGLFLIELNGEGDLINRFLTPIKASNIENISINALHTKEDGINANLHIHNVFFNKTGDITIVGQLLFATGVGNGDWYASDTFVFSLDSKGKQKWTVCIPKLHAGFLPNQITTATHYYNNTTYLICNTKLDIKKEKPIKQTKKGTDPPQQTFLNGNLHPLLVKIDDQGHMTQEELCTAKEMNSSPEDFIYIAPMTYVLADNKLLLCAEKGVLPPHKYKFATLQLK